MPDDPIETHDWSDIRHSLTEGLAALGDVFEDAIAFVDAKRVRMIGAGWHANDASACAAQQLRIILDAFEAAIGNQKATAT